MQCVRCKEERVHYANKMCRKCYRIEWANKQRKCPICGKMFKVFRERTSKQCPQCYQQTYRKGYMREYNKRPEARKTMLAGYKKRRDDKYLIIRELKTKKGCVDCGNKDWRVLEFDHLGDKESGVSRMIATNLSLGRIMAEIDKCEIRCANCHRIKTFERREALS